MDDIRIWLVLIIVVCAVIGVTLNYFIGPKNPFKQKIANEARALEVRIRMEQGEELIDDLRALANLYGRGGKNWEAEQTFQRAINTCSQQFGDRHKTLARILRDYASLLRNLNRFPEADRCDERASRIERGEDPGKTIEFKKSRK
ncbi:MAG: tetratricopeptide repeat protein [Candidatus Obscuribacterales bacterium]